jgi:serine/threonine-protein kinase
MTGSGDEPILLGERYELGGLLGRGGMADVRVARDLRLGRTVAIKQLRADLSSDDTFQARFRREAQSAAALNHPAIVAVYDTGESTDKHGNHIPYIVMEYVEGQTLREIMRDDRKILPERALSITADVLSALDYSHRSGIIHRDIKPANVMLTPSGQVKVMDFGIARAIADSSSAMTQTAAVIGTAQYLSPEQARGETVDARPEVTQAVDHIVAKSLAKRTDDRYQSAADMRKDLERAIAGQQVEAPTAATSVVPAATAVAPAVAAAAATGTQPAVEDEEERKNRKPLYWALAILLLLLLAGIGLYAYNQANQPPPAPAQVEVPDVTGQDAVAAQRTLERDGFTVQTQERADGDVEEGNVVSQDPEGGTEVDKGTEVTLVVSTGPAQVQVPNVVGYTFDEAKAALEGQGLKVKREERASDQSRNSVINTNPAAGVSVDAGTTVTVIVSQGEVQVPNLVGMTQEEAEKTLQEADLEVSVTEDPTATAPKGQVTNQGTPAGTSVPPGTTIEITVSSNEGDDQGGDQADGNGDAPDGNGDGAADLDLTPGQ